jgi:hypothetical protein
MQIASKVKIIAFINLIIFLIWNNTYYFSGIVEIFFLHILKIIAILLLIALFEVFITKMKLIRYQNIF